MNGKYTGSVLDVLKSKRFISSLVIVALTLLAAIIPELEEHFDKIATLATAAIIALVSGYSLQDVVIAIMTGGQIPSPEPPSIASPIAPDTSDSKQAFLEAVGKGMKQVS